QKRKRAVGAFTQEFRPNSQRLICRMTHAKHPLVAANRTDTATHLVGERLNSQAIISGSKRAGNGVARSFGDLFVEKQFNRFLKPSLEQMFVTFEWNEV